MTLDRNMPRVVHFEIHADDPERAADFYQQVFGWKIEKWKGGDYWLVTTGGDDEPGINGGIMKREGKVGEGIIAYVCTVDVPSVDEYSKKIEEAGGKIIMEKHAIPEMGWLAYAKDTEGNMFGIMASDMSAK
jgi:hypothetical protein